MVIRMHKVIEHCTGIHPCHRDRTCISDWTAHYKGGFKGGCDRSFYTLFNLEQSQCPSQTTGTICSGSHRGFKKKKGPDSGWKRKDGSYWKIRGLNAGMLIKFLVLKSGHLIFHLLAADWLPKTNPALCQISRGKHCAREVHSQLTFLVQRL